MVKWRYKLEYHGKALRETINTGGEDLESCKKTLLALKDCYDQIKLLMKDDWWEFEGDYDTLNFYIEALNKDLENVTMDDLSDLGLGYRATYIYGVCKRNPALVMPNYDMLLAIPGIGKKVASCIMLFGAYDLTQFPIDTWMKKLLDEVYNGRFDTTPYKGFEGFIQQLQFYHYRHLKGK